MACALDGAQDFSGSVLVSSIVMAVPAGAIAVAGSVALKRPQAADVNPSADLSNGCPSDMTSPRVAIQRARLRNAPSPTVNGCSQSFATQQIPRFSPVGHRKCRASCIVSVVSPDHPRSTGKRREDHHQCARRDEQRQRRAPVSGSIVKHTNQ